MSSICEADHDAYRMCPYYRGQKRTSQNAPIILPQSQDRLGEQQMNEWVSSWLGWLSAGGSASGTLRVKKRYVCDLAKLAPLETITARQKRAASASSELNIQTGKSTLTRCTSR